VGPGTFSFEKEAEEAFSLSGDGAVKTLIQASSSTFLESKGKILPRGFSSLPKDREEGRGGKGPFTP